MTLINFKHIALLLICCALFGCKVYEGMRVCDKNTSNCKVFKDDRYITNVLWQRVEGYCDRHPNDRITIEDSKNAKTFIIYSCQEYDVYPVWSR